jgi:hypothetical protein
MPFEPTDPNYGARCTRRKGRLKQPTDFGVRAPRPSAGERLAEVCGVAGLTERQATVIRLACSGLRNLDIAEALGLTPARPWRLFDEATLAALNKAETTVRRTFAGAVRKVREVYPQYRARHRSEAAAAAIAVCIRNRKSREWDPEQYWEPAVPLDNGFERRDLTPAPVGHAADLLETEPGCPNEAFLLNLVSELTGAVARIA